MSIAIVRIQVCLCVFHSLSYSLFIVLPSLTRVFCFTLRRVSLVSSKSKTLFISFLRLPCLFPEFHSVLRACAPPWVSPPCKRICFLVICVSYNLWSVSCVPGCSICNKLFLKELPSLCRSVPWHWSVGGQIFCICWLAYHNTVDTTFELANLPCVISGTMVSVVE